MLSDGISSSCAPPKSFMLRSRRRRVVKLKTAGSKPLLDKPRLLRSSTVTLPEASSQPTPSQRQHSVPSRHDESLVVDSWKENDVFSWNCRMCHNHHHHLQRN